MCRLKRFYPKVAIATPIIPRAKTVVIAVFVLASSDSEEESVIELL